MATTRERLHELLEAVPEDRLSDAQAVLEEFVDPVLQALLQAPEDDEPTTAEDLAALDEARRDHERGELQSLDAVLADLGHSPGR